MLGSAQKFFRLSLYSLLLFAPHSAIAGSSKYLNGINMISYKVIVEKTVGGDRCNIDQESLNTSIAQFTCAGSINAEVLAYFEEQAHMIPTRAPIYPPMIEIWSVKFGFVAPRQSFSNDAINLTEQIMKQLVNDWAASQ
jgi:hypothetical protein